MDCSMDLDECHDMIQCKYNGTCFNTYGDYFCRCPENFSGRHCEVYLPQNHELVNNYSNLVYVPYEKKLVIVHYAYFITALICILF